MSIIPAPTVEVLDEGVSQGYAGSVDFAGAGVTATVSGNTATVTISGGAASQVFSRGGVVLDPTGARNYMVWRAPFACTVTNVRGHRMGGSGATVNARLNQTSQHLASDLSLSSADTWMDGGAVQNTAYVAGDDLEIQVTSVGGTPTEITIQVDYTKP